MSDYFSQKVSKNNKKIEEQTESFVTFHKNFVKSCAQNNFKTTTHGIIKKKLVIFPVDKIC